MVYIDYMQLLVITHHYFHVCCQRWKSPMNKVMSLNDLISVYGYRGAATPKLKVQLQEQILSTWCLILRVESEWSAFQNTGIQLADWTAVTLELVSLVFPIFTFPTSRMPHPVGGAVGVTLLVLTWWNGYFIYNSKQIKWKTRIAG